MTRKKVKLAYITNDSARKATFKKRKKGFLKKMYELTTLCEIRACAIIYSPYDAAPEVWPNLGEAKQVLAKFKRLPEMEKSKKMVNQEEFLRQRINKAAELLKKLQKDNREKEMTQVMYQCLTGKSIEDMSMIDLTDLGWLIDQNLKEIYKRIGQLKKEVALPKVAAKQAAAGTAAVEEFGRQRGSGGFDPVGMEQAVQGQSWFMDMMNPHDYLGGPPSSGGSSINGGGRVAGESKMLMTFADYNHSLNPLWSCANFFP
ncbi:hypothetical protein Nepgr_032152 [Nepenthes gracilis]|uniref:MADS-box domain-containing protein n=1 Tax=Nepenthes gracilis TaxID=150966 RepID=A0AAD3TJF6_NEPGR|nr:hypothetical protein Nepgr_032152 [Nepenthes gracilis]